MHWNRRKNWKKMLFKKTKRRKMEFLNEQLIDAIQRNEPYLTFLEEGSVVEEIDLTFAITDNKNIEVNVWALNEDEGKNGFFTIPIQEKWWGKELPFLYRVGDAVMITEATIVQKEKKYPEVAWNKYRTSVHIIQELKMMQDWGPGKKWMPGYVLDKLPGRGFVEVQVDMLRKPSEMELKKHKLRQLFVV